jgi:hypothetical protein
MTTTGPTRLLDRPRVAAPSRSLPARRGHLFRLRPRESPGLFFRRRSPGTGASRTPRRNVSADQTQRPAAPEGPP